MRHTSLIPRRFADLDLVGHVNNVAFLDYVQEARIELLRSSEIDPRQRAGEGVVVARHEVAYRAPLAFGMSPARVDTWVSQVRAASFTMSFELYDVDESGHRRVYFEGASVLAPVDLASGTPRRLTAVERNSMRELADESKEQADATSGSTYQPQPPIPPVGEPLDPSAHRTPVPVRFSDLDPYGHVNNVKYLELFQEGRVRFTRDLRRPGDEPWAQWVVARTDIDYLSPMTMRQSPYDVRTAVSEVGNRSATLVGDIVDEFGGTFARSRVLIVAFDSQTQRSAPMTDELRERLRESMELTSGRPTGDLES